MQANQKTILQSFISVTNCDQKEATRLLKAHDWDLETCIELYFAQQSESPTKSNKKEKLETKDNNFGEEEELRAPLATTTGVLSEDPLGMIQTNARKIRERGFNKKTPSSVFDTFRDFKRESQILEANAKSKNKENTTILSAEEEKKKKLEELFRPPVDLIFAGPFDDAKKQGEMEKKWILVNIQETSEFDCHRLNRDTWSDLNLKRIISNNFIFWQKYTTSEDAIRYKTFYLSSNKTMPHIGIIDPRTGESLVQIFGFKSAEDLASLLSDFLADHSLFDFDAPSKPRSAKRKVIIDQSEEDQLKAAIQMSLHESDPKLIPSPQSTLENPLKRQKSSEISNVNSIQSEKKEVNSIASEKKEEDKKEATSTVIVNRKLDSNVEQTDIAIRMPDGSRSNSKFAGDDKLLSLQDFISHALGKPSSSFDILTSFPLKKIEDFERSFKEIGLFPRALVNVQLK